MEAFKNCFCRPRRQELYEAKRQNLALQIELEKKNLRINRLLQRMKEFMVQHSALMEQQERFLLDSVKATQEKIDPVPAESFVKATPLLWSINSLSTD